MKIKRFNEEFVNESQNVNEKLGKSNKYKIDKMRVVFDDDDDEDFGAPFLHITAGGQKFVVKLSQGNDGEYNDGEN